MEEEKEAQHTYLEQLLRQNDDELRKGLEAESKLYTSYKKMTMLR